MNISIGKKAVLLCRAAGITSFMWGFHGLGKSSIHKQVCRERFWGFIDERCSQMEASDLRGLPDKQNQRTVYLPPGSLPREHEVGPNCPACFYDEEFGHDPKDEANKTKFDEILKTTPDADYCKGMLFLDELNRAEDDVLQAAFQLVLDREIGMYKLPPGWSVHVAGNFGGGQGMYSVNNFDDAAFLDRFCHLTLSPDDRYMEDWSKYMVEREEDGIINKILQFVSFNEDHLTGKLTGSNDISIQPSPRSWEMVSKVEAACRKHPELIEGRKTVISGLIGHGLVETYEQFTCKVTPNEIMNQGLRSIQKKLEDLNRNELVGLVWALGANAKKLERPTTTVCNNVIDFLEWLANVNAERDLAVSLSTNLVTLDGTERSLSGALVSNPSLAKLAKKYGIEPDKSKNDTGSNPWLEGLTNRPSLQDLLSSITKANDSATSTK
tara:strand:- start:108004 stop:109320 length:1317 start_codon:yes stop_codon:yes gene_type:complete